jgi:hypothetical protein
VKLSKVEEFMLCGSNAMNILSFSKIHIGTQDFKGIHLKEAYMKSLNCYKCDFEGAVLE